MYLPDRDDELVTDIAASDFSYVDERKATVAAEVSPFEIVQSDVGDEQHPPSSEKPLHELVVMKCPTIEFHHATAVDNDLLLNPCISATNHVPITLNEVERVLRFRQCHHAAT